MSTLTPRLDPACVSCLVKKQIDRYPPTASPDEVMLYLRRLGALIADLPTHAGGPHVMEAITRLRYELFGDAARAMDGDYAPIKTHFNTLMAATVITRDLRGRIKADPDPLRVALGYAMVGNFIDFGAMDSVDEQKLAALLDRAPAEIPADHPVLLALKDELAHAREAVLLCDNCGEIALDRLLCETLIDLYPTLHLTVLVRGAPVLNDATLRDAHEVGLDTLPAARVTLLDNGDTLAGTDPDRLSAAARRALLAADVILSKGMGNFETLRTSRLPVYYAFLCKCSLFATRFSVDLYTGVLAREE